LPPAFPAALLTFVPIGIYALSLAAGVTLWQGSSFGRKASFIVQIIQLSKIISPVLIYAFSFGFDVWVHFLMNEGFWGTGIEFRVLAYSQLFFDVQGAPISLGISLTACIFLVTLFLYKPGAPSPEQALPPSPQVVWGDAPDHRP